MFSQKNPHLYIWGGTTACSTLYRTPLLSFSLHLGTPSSIHNRSHWNPHICHLLCSFLHCWSIHSCLHLTILTQTPDSNLLGHLIFLFGRGTSSTFIATTLAFSTFLSSHFSHFACCWHFFSSVLACLIHFQSSFSSSSLCLAYSFSLIKFWNSFLMKCILASSTCKPQESSFLP